MGAPIVGGGDGPVIGITVSYKDFRAISPNSNAIFL
jgi:hypothetical protein